MRAWIILAALAFAATATAQPASAAEKRVALVIGVADYAAARRLANPVHDARAVEAALQNLGFKVVIETDRSRRRLMTALDDFAEEHKGADLALVFFAGHGVQIEGRNYLLPTDVKGASAAELKNSAVALDDLFARLATVAERRIVLLDACRNDPFGASGAGAGGAADGRGYAAAQAAPANLVAGLARIGRADGTLFAFATAPGATASDGSGRNSPFTEALAAHLGKGGLELSSIMKLVQMEVYEKSRGRQLPYIEDALPSLVFTDTKGEPLPERDRLLLAMARIDADTRAQVERIAGVKNLPLAPLYGALLAAQADDFDTRERRLTRAAEDFIKVRTDLQTLAASDPEVAQLRAQAERDLSLGAFAAARAALTRAIAVDGAAGDRLEARLKERNLSEAASRAVRAGVARTRLDYRVAADDLKTAADLAERWDKLAAWRYRHDQASNLALQGSDFGDNAALIEAITVYRFLLAAGPSAERTEDWAKIQNNLGAALQILGARERGTARLEEAVAAYQAALAGQTRERAPLAWAGMQNNLAGALQKLGERESGTARLVEAVAAYRAALTQYTRELAPLDWAVTQGNLANALTTLGDRDSSTARLEEAVAVYRAALSELTRESAPLVWAATQNNLGGTLQTLAERKSDAAPLMEAVAAYRAALTERTRARAPLAWATTQANLANALAILGRHETGTARLEEAVAAYQAALAEHTRERTPLAWASIQNNLANALRILGERESSTARLAAAAAAYRAALTEYSRERAPLDWAHATYNLAVIELTIGARSPPGEHAAYLSRARALVADALAAYRDAKADAAAATAERVLTSITAELKRISQ